MKFSDIPIKGYRIEVDEYALGQFVLEKFVERFMIEDEILYGPRIKTKHLYPYYETVQKE